MNVNSRGKRSQLLLKGTKITPLNFSRSLLFAIVFSSSVLLQLLWLVDSVIYSKVNTVGNWFLILVSSQSLWLVNPVNQAHNHLSHWNPLNKAHCYRLVVQSDSSAFTLRLLLPVALPFSRQPSLFASSCIPTHSLGRVSTDPARFCTVSSAGCPHRVRRRAFVTHTAVWHAFTSAFCRYPLFACLRLMCSLCWTLECSSLKLFSSVLCMRMRMHVRVQFGSIHRILPANCLFLNDASVWIA